MNPRIYFYVAFALLTCLVMIFDWKYNMLKDDSTAEKKPYSFARVQLSWWTIIIVSSIISIIFTHKAIPNFDNSILYLIGIASGTTLAAKMIDVNHDANQTISQAAMSRNQGSQGFIIDILSDGKGISIPRLQSFLFNLVFGGYFCFMVLVGLKAPITTLFSIDNIMPILNTNTLMLMGISSVGYASFKFFENVAPPKEPVV